MADLATILDDLIAEGDDLDALVADLEPAEWTRPTPAVGWTISDQIAHLAWTDDATISSATNPQKFKEIVAAAWRNPTTFVDDGARAWAAEPAAELLETWRSGRTRLVEALAGVEPGRKLDWFGPPMSAASMATARLMETWAHGQDVADALGATRVPTNRLRHVAHLGVRTRDFAFGLHELPPPAEQFRVELRAPAGDTWSWGPEDAGQRVTGSALDFCLLVTQRRHRDDLDVTATGPDAQRWLTLAQAFAGLPGSGRAAGQFRRTGAAS